jgi:hypothetical protein
MDPSGLESIEDRDYARCLFRIPAWMASSGSGIDVWALGCRGIGFSVFPYMAQKEEVEARSGAGPTSMDLKRERIRKMLEKEGCAKAVGASSSFAAQLAISVVDIEYNSLPLFFDTATGTLHSTFGQYGGNTLSLNSQINWQTPQATVVSVVELTLSDDGITVIRRQLGEQVFDLVLYMARSIGLVGSMGTVQFEAMVLLHELSHHFGVSHLTKDELTKLNQSLWRECVR